MKPLRQEAIFNRSQHQFVGGFLNVGYLSGYVLSWDPASRLLLLLQSNNHANALPVVVPASVRVPPGLKQHSLIKVLGLIAGSMLQSQPGAYTARVIARGFTRPTTLELPNYAAMQKATAESQPNQPPGEAFRPFGSGNTLTSPGNTIELAGIVLGWRTVVTQPSATSSGSTYVEVLLRHSSNPNHVIPVRLYKSIAKQAAQPLKPGTPIFVTGKYRVNVIPAVTANGEPELDGDGSQKFRRICYIDAQLPMVADETVVLDLAPGRALPQWVSEIIAIHQNKRAPMASVPTANKATQPVIAPIDSHESAPVTERAALAASFLAG